MTNIIAYLRTFRIGPFAIFDFAISYLAVWIFAPFIIKLVSYIGFHPTRANLMWLVVPASILAHILVGTYTPLTKMFLNPSGDYIVKIIVLLMLYKGFV